MLQSFVPDYGTNTLNRETLNRETLDESSCRAIGLGSDRLHLLQSSRVPEFQSSSSSSGSSDEQRAELSSLGYWSSVSAPNTLSLWCFLMQIAFFSFPFGIGSCAIDT